MSILMADKMRPLLQEVIVALPVDQFHKTLCQMNDMDIIFPLIPQEFVWVKSFENHSTTKLSIFSDKIQDTEKLSFSKSLKTSFFKMLSFIKRFRFFHETNCKLP